MFQWNEKDSNVLAVEAESEDEIMHYNEFKGLPKNVRDKVIEETFLNANGQNTKHAICDIVAGGREKAIGARMWNGKKEITKFEFQNGNIVPVGSEELEGEDVAKIYINSVKKNGCAWYPVTGTSWAEAGVKQIVLFVKREGKYVPYARFDIEKIEKKVQMDSSQIATLIDPSVIFAMRYKCILKLTNVKTDDLPKNYLGLSSGEDVYDSAFNGMAPNVLIL